MRINNNKRMYIPALSIAAVVLILLLFIAVSTYRNFYRDRRTIESFLERQGLVVFKALEIGMEMAPSSSHGKQDFQTLITKISEIDDVAYIYVTDSKGVVIYRGGEALEKNVVKLQDFKSAPGGIFKRIRRLPDERGIYEMTKAFFGPDGKNAEKSPALSLKGPSAHPPGSSEKIIIVGLWMTRYEQSLYRDLHHAMIMASILLVLGSGLVFFIFVIQNYYLIDKTLKQTRDYTRQVVASMANGLISIDSQGKVVSYNRLALDLLQLKEKEIKGMDLNEIMDFDTYGISETLNNNSSVLEREVVYRGKPGIKIPVSVSVTPILSDETELSGAVIILRDLREIKRLQEKVHRSEKLAAVGELAAGVAHEIRNPLSSIKGFAQFLRHVLKDRPEEKEYATVMVNEIDRINRVVTDLLLYAKPLSATKKEEDLNELLDHVILLVNADAHSRGITIRKNLSEELKNIRIDRNQMIHALLNLLLNSLEAVPEGGNIEIGAGLTDNRELHLWVEDDGTGIPPDHHKKIMDPFFTTRDKGTGLGLAIVHKIIENNDGEIRIESPPQGKKQGTIIHLLIPLPTENEEIETR